MFSLMLRAMAGRDRTRTRAGRSSDPARAWRRAAGALLAALVLAQGPAHAGTTAGQNSPAPAEAVDAGAPTPWPSCGTSLLPGLAAAGRLPALEAAAAKTVNGEGKLFRIERPGVAPSFLFGTMHLTDPRVLTLEPQAEAALSGARQVVIETTDILDGMTGTAAMLARPDLLNLPAGKTLGTYLDADQRLRIEAKLKALGIPFQSIETLQPWFFAVGILVPACEMQRQAAGAEVLDVTLARRAKAANKPVLGLETATEQLEAIASLPIDLQVDSLIATLEIKDRMPDVFETMIDLYGSGRIALIAPVTETLMPLSEVPAESVKAYAEFESRVVTIRNRTMLERLGPILREGQAFVAVGALHLPGPDGLVELLRREGYTLTRAD